MHASGSEKWHVSTRHQNGDDEGREIRLKASKYAMFSLRDLSSFVFFTPRKRSYQIFSEILRALHITFKLLASS